MLQASDVTLRDRAVRVGDRICIGRRAQPAVTLVIDDKLLSGMHASIVWGSDGFELIDHDSKNGSFVDGERVQRKRLVEGAVLRLGIHLFEFAVSAERVDSFDGSVKGDETHALAGRSAALRGVVSAIDALAGDDRPVLLVGELGAGKEAAGRRLHSLNGRSGDFVSLACTTSSPGNAARLLFGDPSDESDVVGRSIGGTRIVPAEVGLFARANHGTLLLDGVDMLDRQTQERILQFIRTRLLELPSGERVLLDVHVIGASEVDIEPLVDDGSFSPELFECLRDRTIELTPLRARRGDIPVLVPRVWADISRGGAVQVSATALEKLVLYDWPMNVREVVSVLARVYATAGPVEVLRSAHLPAQIRQRGHQETADQLRASAVSVQLVPSRDELTTLLEKFHGDVAALASFFSMNKRQVYHWLKRHDLKLSAFRKTLS